MSGGVTLQLELWHAITLVGMLVGAFYALVKIIVSQFEKRLDERFAVQEKARSDASTAWTARFDQLFGMHRELERSFREHLAELPNKYQRREDAIRQEVGIISRLDGLADMVTQRFRDTDTKIEGLRGS